VLNLTIGNPAVSVVLHFFIAVQVSILVLRLSRGRALSIVCGLAGTAAALLIGYGLQLVSGIYNDLIMAPYLDWQILAPHWEDTMCFSIFSVLPFIVASSVCGLRRRRSPTAVRRSRGMTSTDRVLCWVAIASVPLSALGDITGPEVNNLLFNRVVPVAFAVVGSLRLWRMSESVWERRWARPLFLLSVGYAIRIGYFGWKAM
jgi:hypothetical protein